MPEKWTMEQAIVVFNLYCRIPFQKASSTNPDILETAKIIGRSPNSVKMKIGNFGSFDPELKSKGIVGLANSSRLDKQIWDEFNNDWESLSFESEKLIKEFKGQPVENSNIFEDTSLPQGMDKAQTIKARVNQSFFRSAVLSAYNNTCCITGLSIPNLLIASHIKPWKDSDHATERTNPRNGLCLNALHDKVFDAGLITIDINYRIILSKDIKDMLPNEVVSNYFERYEGKHIQTPHRFLPMKELLEYHNKNIFKG